jgi:hypothetical protein
MSNIYSFRPRIIRYLPDRVYDSIAPLTANDNGDLRAYVDSIGQMTREIEDLARDDADGNPGWSSILDADRCPVQFLPWLAQAVGVVLPDGLSEADQRTYIKSTDGWKRGRPAAIKAAPIKHLTGDRTVLLYERTPDAYGFTVITFTAQTPDSALVLADLLAAKPAGLNLTYVVHSGQSYQDIYDNYATYELVYTTYATYEDVLNDTP